MNLKSRKLLGCAVLFATATTAFYTGDLPSAEWVDFSKWIFIAYVFGNVAEHYVYQSNK